MKYKKCLLRLLQKHAPLKTEVNFCTRIINERSYLVNQTWDGEQKIIKNKGKKENDFNEYRHRIKLITTINEFAFNSKFISDIFNKTNLLVFARHEFQ